MEKSDELTLKIAGLDIDETEPAMLPYPIPPPKPGEPPWQIWEVDLAQATSIRQKANVENAA